MTVRIACAADARYLPHAAVTIRSALVAGGAAEAYLLHPPRIEREARSRLEEMAAAAGGGLSFLEVPDERIAGLPAMDYVSRVMWYRIFLPELLPGVDRVLYLDADTIVLDSLAPLFELELERRWVGAVTNVFQRADPQVPERFERERSGRPYFNSGVLLMNLAEMRRDDCARRLYDYARENARTLGWPDQDALNHVLGERRRPLHPRWNWMNSMSLFPWAAEAFEAGELEEARRRPAIRHFEGPSVNKPWHYLCARDMRELYVEHRRRTPWPQVQLEGATPGNRLRRLLGLAARA